MTRRKPANVGAVALLRSAGWAFLSAVLCLTLVAVLPDSFMRGPTEPRGSGGGRAASGRSSQAPTGGLHGVGHKLHAAHGGETAQARREFTLAGKAQEAKAIKIPLRPMRILFAVAACACLIGGCLRAIQALIAMSPQPDPIRDLPRLPPMP